MYQGGRLDYTVFDVKEDNTFNDQDKVLIDGVPVPVSGLDLGIGIVKTPAVIDLPPPHSPDAPSEMKAVSGTSGSIGKVFEAGSEGLGRQYWEQLR